MKKILILTSGCMIMLACNNQQKTDADTKSAAATTDSSTTKTQPQSEFADPKYTDMGKRMLTQFESGDVDGWANNFADNAVYLWSAGDSLAGKKAITDYWKTRRATVIDSIKFTNDIWLPLKVNTPQKGPDLPGVWLLSWYQVNVKYKNGKKLQFWVHNDFHYDANDKVDRTVQYIDRAPINAALAAKK
ncbi:MAG: nuclear transport factor 2 family protein [Bacteroidetes bacterium]|nr:MAG: nuclear transport factor 2 family protein [Bacteroidota bacterium]